MNPTETVQSVENPRQHGGPEEEVQEKSANMDDIIANISNALHNSEVSTPSESYDMGYRDVITRTWRTGHGDEGQSAKAGLPRSPLVPK